MAYQPGVPTGSVPLDQDYLNLQGNFSSLDAQWKIDHSPLTGPGTPPNGYHTAIHLVPQSPIPTAVAGYGELYAQTVNDGTAVGQQLWYQFINGSAVTVNYALTRNFLPVAAATGYTFLPGNIIKLWGQVTTGGTGTAVISYSPIVLQTPAFSIQITQLSTDATGGIRNWGQVFATSTTGFTLAAIKDGGGRDTTGPTFYWEATGS
jgi:hypothetical protein